MCKQCENNFLMEVIESTSKEDAIAQFRQDNLMFHLPAENEFMVEEDLIGFWTYSQHIEEIESRFHRELANREKPMNKLYIYSSKLLNAQNVVVVVCVANRRGYACTSLNYMPGRRF